MILALKLKWSVVTQYLRASRGHTLNMWEKDCEAV